MGAQYDSQKIHSLASQISRVASAVSEVKSTTLKDILREMPENFKGSAATALQESVSDLMMDVSAISSHLSAVSGALQNLAARVEWADQQAKTQIQGR